MSDVFISYASEDKARILPLVHALQQRGWTVWWDRTILAGKVWEREIEAALEASRCVIVAWSNASVQSGWVWTEAHEGNQRGILVPVLLDPVTIPLAFRRLHAANLAGWHGEMPNSEFEELARAVTAVLGSGAPPAAAEVKFKVNPKDNLRYVWIPPGKFMMGCSPGDSECYDKEKPSHEVSISHGFWMGQTAVTQAAYKAVTGKPNPSHFKGDDLPVEQVTWEEAKFYCEAVGMRLPTEAEWEYAARAGSTGARYSSLDEVAWYDGNSGGKTHPVAQKLPNAWGLYDTLGNVWEWCSDWYGNYSEGRLDDPTGPQRREMKIVRGGSWRNYPRNVRVSGRLGYAVVPQSASGFVVVGNYVECFLF